MYIAEALKEKKIGKEWWVKDAATLSGAIFTYICEQLVQTHDITFHGTRIPEQNTQQTLLATIAQRLKIKDPQTIAAAYTALSHSLSTVYKAVFAVFY